MNLLHKLVRFSRSGRARLNQALGEESPMARLVRRQRGLFWILISCGISALAFLLAFVIRYELSRLDSADLSWHSWFIRTVGLVVLVRLGAFVLLGLHRTNWRFAGAYDVFPLFASILISSAVIVPAVLHLWDGFFPRSILAMDAIICFMLLAAARFSYRLVDDFLGSLGRAHRTKVIVVGAGAAGNLTVRAMLTRGLVDYWPVAILDDDPYKQGTTLQGVPVKGPISRVAEIAARTGAQAIVLALPTATTSKFYKVVRQCKQTGLPLKTTPDLAQILSSSNVVTRISDFCLEDLLHRRPIRPDVPQIQEFLTGRTVLVTGAAGSIGSELCRQISEQGTSRLICVDKDENGLFRLEHELTALPGEVDTKFFLADIKDNTRMDEAFGTWRPEVVFHAAAYKHVPILQHNPVEAIRNNVTGTATIADLADTHGVAQFVLISTDKAVNPTSVMGATKRVAERVVRAKNLRSATRFSIIRFGNVLGSNGSVVELFLDQIKRGKPLTVTHEDIERFFMTIPEAVHLVLYSATMGVGGETFILDMGKPVKILELARQIIRLSGLTPDVDVPIEIIGLRPGEKLYEELWTDQEQPRRTNHPGILLAPGEETLPDSMAAAVGDLRDAAARNDPSTCWQKLLELVPSFQGRTNGLAQIPPDQRAEESAS